MSNMTIQDSLLDYILDRVEVIQYPDEGKDKPTILRIRFELAHLIEVNIPDKGEIFAVGMFPDSYNSYFLVTVPYRFDPDDKEAVWWRRIVWAAAQDMPDPSMVWQPSEGMYLIGEMVTTAGLTKFYT